MGVQPITSTESQFVPLIWAGGYNVADEIGRTGHFFIDPEQLLVWNPANIFIDAGGLEKVVDGYRRNPAFFKRLRAVKDGHVFLIMPYNNYHTNIEIALADAWFIGKSLYPERFVDVEPTVKANEIFTFFLGVKAYAALQKEYHGFSRIRFSNDELVLF
jgi:iron complex transport system substrate-binding protein